VVAEKQDSYGLVFDYQGNHHERTNTKFLHALAVDSFVVECIVYDNHLFGVDGKCGMRIFLVRYLRSDDRRRKAVCISDRPSIPFSDGYHGGFGTNRCAGLDDDPIHDLVIIKTGVDDEVDTIQGLA